jgi:putative hydrolase of the HAD superfamily
MAHARVQKTSDSLRVVLRAVVFDVDFTLARPGPELGPDGYRELGLRYGLDLDPARYEEARADAIAEVKRHPEFDHDEEIWILFTEQIIRGMGGEGPTYAAAVEMERGWMKAAHFALYDDALPALEELRRHGLKLGLLSNSARDLDEFVAHHGIAVDAVLTSFSHGKTKPHESIFWALLALLDVNPSEALMIGDTVEDDFEGALAIGMQAMLLDRDDRFPDVSNRIRDLTGLPTALGLG